jgi:hypothetical protein
VHTYSSDAPIGDSAPTSSCYATGQPSQTGFIATYPVSVAGRDLVKLDPSRAYQPLTTVLEAAKLKKKSTGIVVTCHFPHATPADFSAHTPERDLYFPIATQMVYNNLDVMMGGGQNYLDPKVRTDGQNLVSVLKKRGYTVANNVKDFKALNSRDTLVWSLLTKEDFPYDLDRKLLNDSLPSLATMTNSALRILNQNPNGFFLMVEGSKIGTYLDGLFASEFLEEEQNGKSVISGIARAIGFIKKTEYIHLINKGGNVDASIDINGMLPPEQRRVPFENMFFIGDGFTDIPCFATLNHRGGTSFGVYNPELLEARVQAGNLLRQGRVQNIHPADYRPESSLYKAVVKRCREMVERGS